MHIYHYAPYEETAIKRLISYYGTRENEVDNLLRYNILVDLYKIVREGVMVSEPRYSIKNLEHFYMDKREGDVKSGGESIVYFDIWRKTELPDRLSVGQGPPIETTVLEKALYRFADTVISNGSKYSAIKDFLYKKIPRIYGHTEGTPIAGGFNPSINSIIKAVTGLQKSYLFIQGPPGSGKTYTGSHIIAALLQIGKKVGISSNSHKAINNLLDGVVSAAKKQGVRFRGVKKISSSDKNSDQSFEDEFIRNEKDNNMVLSDDPQLIAGTAWLFADSDFDELLDYLFVDEAGQVSLAHLVAMGTSAKNIILLGDQMQLGQPIQGVHPGDSGKSALEYLLEERTAIPPEEGVFLGTTYRMHDDICRFISDAVYDGKLHPESSNKNQCLILKKDAHEAIKPTGISFLKVQHSRCKQKSREEAEIIVEIYRSLLHQSYQDKNGNNHPMKPEDILIVSPYNMQVDLLKKSLPAEARVGTIDKFQGQEANVVIISMATSSGEDLPRNIEFLYSKNRLNVAISRAKCLAVLVANPNLLSIKCNMVEQMELVNTLCWLDEYAARFSRQVNIPALLAGI